MRLRFLVPPALGRAKSGARAELIARALSEHLGVVVQAQACSSYEELERAAIAGDAELVWATAALAVQLEASAQAIFKVRRGGQSRYHSAIIAKRDAGLTVGRLRGKRAAWVSRRSIGGFLLAREFLQQRDRTLLPALAEQRFVGSHPEAAMAVLADQSDFAAVAATRPDEASVRQMLRLYVGPQQVELEPIAVTRAAPTDGIAALASLPMRFFEPLRGLLLGSEEKGRSARPHLLLSALDAEGFDEARRGEYADLRSLFVVGPPGP